MTYDQPATTIAQQLEILRNQGLQITNRSQAVEALSTIGYFRLKNYLMPLMSGEPDSPQLQVSLERLIERYDLDTNIKALTFAMCQRIEIRIKAVMSSTLSLRYSPVLPDSAFFHLETASYWQKNLAQVRKQALEREEEFVSYYQDKYHEFPIWVNLELSTFGGVSRFYSWLMRDAQKAIAAEFGISNKYLWSWLRTLTLMRNLCAHQARLLGRTKILSTMIPKKFRCDFPSNSYAAVIFILSKLLTKREFSGYIYQLSLIIDRHADQTELTELGLTDAWQSHALGLI